MTRLHILFFACLVLGPSALIALVTRIIRKMQKTHLASLRAISDAPVTVNGEVSYA